MPPLETHLIRVDVHVNMGFWDAVKIRLAGRHMNHLVRDIERRLKDMADASVAEHIDNMQSQKRMEGE